MAKADCVYGRLVGRCAKQIVSLCPILRGGPVHTDFSIYKECDRACGIGNGGINEGELSGPQVGVQPGADVVAQRRYGLYRNNAKPLEQVELGVFAFVRPDVVDQVALHGSPRPQAAFVLTARAATVSG